MAKRSVPAGPPAFLQSKNTIRPALIRGRLYHVVGDVAFDTFRLAVCAWSAAEAHRLDVIDNKIAEPTVETFLRQAQLLLEEARVAAEFGDPATHGLQRQAREVLAEAIDQLPREVMP